MAKPQTLQPGDRIAYAAKHLKNAGMQTGGHGDRRGTYIGPNGSPGFVQVRWDDFEATVICANGAGQYGDPEWVALCRERGSMIHESAIAKVGSDRFACNDL